MILQLHYCMEKRKHIFNPIYIGKKTRFTRKFNRLGLQQIASVHCHGHEGRNVGLKLEKSEGSNREEESSTPS